MRSATTPSRLVRLAATVAVALVVAACGSTTPTSRSAAPAATASAASAAATVAGATQPPAILQFKAPLVAGGALDGTTFTGKPVAFWFWAPW